MNNISHKFTQTNTISVNNISDELASAGKTHKHTCKQEVEKTNMRLMLFIVKQLANVLDKSRNSILSKF